jgi:deoxyribose-phosphate aldolase
MKPLTQWIDHTALKADTTTTQIRKLCAEAMEFQFFAVCVNSSNIALAKRLLEGSSVKIATVVGFPLGASTSEVKAFEAMNAISRGADEIDMVMNIGAAKSGEWDVVQRDIEAVVAASGSKIVKVIIETSLLSLEEKIRACLAAKKGGAKFVKTSTGFSTGGATIEDIRIMRETVGSEMGVKASGGLKTKLDFENMLKAGATRLGTSAAVQALQGEVPLESY